MEKIKPIDVRQVSGYARLHKVYEKIGMKPQKGQPHQLIDCLIIYPEDELKVNLKEYRLIISKVNPHPDFAGVFKLGVPLPAIALK